MELYLPKNHTSLNVAKDIQAICTPLFSQTKFKYLTYVKLFDDGTLSVLTTDPKWHQHYWQAGYNRCTNLRLITGVHTWYDKDKLSSIDLDARNNFNRHNTVDMIYKKDRYYEAICLATEREQLNIFEHHQQHLPYIKDKFLFYFKEQAYKLIRDSDAKENRIRWRAANKSDQPSVSNEDNLNFSIKQYYINRSCTLTKLQMACFILYMIGYSARQISEILPRRSRKTIEGYIEKVKLKTGCTSRPAMFRFAKTNNLLHLVEDVSPHIN